MVSSALRPALHICAVLCAMSASALHAAGTLETGRAGMQARAAVDFAIQVPRVLELHALEQPDAVEVTAEDVREGQVTIRGSRLHLVSNDPRGTTLRAELRHAAFRAVRIDGLTHAPSASSEHFSVTLPSMVGRPRPAPIEVAYVLTLQPDAAPGRYAWPVALSLGAAGSDS